MFAIGDEVLVECPGSWANGKTGTLTALDVIAPDAVRGHQVEIPGAGVTVVPPGELRRLGRVPVGPARRKPTDGELANRYTYHPPKGDQAERYAAIRDEVLGLALFIRDHTPCSPEQSLAFNALDQAMFLANAAIARNE
jgi:hypothetical protein